MLEEVLESEEKIENWIEDWLKLFPENSGRPLRTNSRECLDRMKWFKNNFSYNKKQIFEATTNYIERHLRSAEGLKYARNSTYFIFKGREGSDRISDLATECEKLKEEKYNYNLTINRDVV